MLFTTDKQTLDDLQIFGKQGSIFNLFNRTASAQGALMLEEMFRYPLSDAEHIQARSAFIAGLAKQQIAFPFNAALIDTAEQYLAVTDERTRLSGEKQTLATRLNNLIATDPQYKLIHNGILAMMEIARQLGNLLQQIPDISGILPLLQAAPFTALLQEAALPYEKIVQYDNLLRFQHITTVKRIMDYVYTLDVYVAAAQVAITRGFTFATPAADILIEGLHHPQVKNAVTNTIELSFEKNILFLTGANMAGKSTFMKSFGVAMYLAHMGFPVPAISMRFPVLHGIYTTINLPDNLGMGASHFYAEVLRIKKIAKELAAGKRMLVIFDELFRGTNVKDACDATIAITTAFAARKRGLFIISTHIIEAGEALQESCSGIVPKYLPTFMEGNTPRYTYQLQDGLSPDRHGMIIIENEGILQILNKEKL